MNCFRYICYIYFFFNINPINSTRTPTANMICISYGTVCGWPSASFPDLLSTVASPLSSGPLDMEQLSWVGSFMCIGSIFGNSFYSWASDRFGRKNALIQSALPCLVSVQTNAQYSEWYCF